MKLKILLTLAIFLPALNSFAKGTSYNRNTCDKKINASQFIFAGSLDNPSPGGKTYNFTKLVGSIENELLGGGAPRPKEFECYTNLFAKAHNDATTYWSETMARTSCADKENNIPSVKPEGCPDDVWNEFHRSKELIDASIARVDRLMNDCVKNEKTGRRSCESRNSLLALEQVAAPLAASKMDQCCSLENKKNPGPAFRVLRSFYTFEYGSLSDAELQKECYKRTRPNTDGVAKTGARMVGNCVKGLIFGIFESLKKSASTLAKLLDFGMWTELTKLIFTKPLSTIAGAIGRLIQAITNQVKAQTQAFAGCFSGPYQADQLCKMASSLITDYFTGAGLVKIAKGLIATVKGGTTAANAFAKGLLAESPKAKLLQGKLQEIARSVTSNVHRPLKVLTSQVTSATKVAVGKLASMRKSLGRFADKVKKGIIEVRTRAGQAVAGQGRLTRTPSPNASTTVTFTTRGGAVAPATQPTKITASAATTPAARSKVLASERAKVTADVAQPFMATIRGVGEGAAPTTMASAGVPSGASRTIGVIGGSTSSSAGSFTSKVVKLDLNTFIPTSTKLSGSAQKTWNDLSTYVRKAQNNAGSATPTSIRNNVYKGKGDWYVSRESLRRHRDIQEMYRRGTITDDQARALHDIVESTEKMATGIPTRYNTSYIVSPNASPSTFTKITEKGTAIAATPAARHATRSAIGATASNAQYNRNLDENTELRYEKDTVEQAIQTVDELNGNADAVKKKFDELESEEDVLDMADYLRTKVKTAEYGFTSHDPDYKAKLKVLLDRINNERNRALSKLGGQPPAKEQDTSGFGE